MSRYFIGIDADEIISSLYHGGNGFATYAEAIAHLATYDPDMMHFLVYCADIRPVTSEQAHGQHVPSLSSIVDQLTARAEWVQANGNPDEAQMLEVVMQTVIAYAQREARLTRAIERIEQRVKEAS